MVFPSVAFLCFFLPIFLFAYAVLPFRNLVILALSLVFYAWGEGIFVVLLMLTVILNYGAGRLIFAATEQQAKYCLGAGVGLNLLILAYFKYFGFITASVLSMDIADTPHLPLGISFFIFQSISYLVDVYRKDSPPSISIFDLALYITMFPQLVAGPIVRYATVGAAINERSISLRQVRDGVLLFIGGLCQKMLIANNAAEIADAAFSLPLDEVGAVAAWLGSLAYALQIFFDFAGYSTMAIGIGLIMGFRFPANFNYPYVSKSITEFWRRWHISLSSWFRDYVYIPLGGNRKGPTRTLVNLFTVFLLCGLWHGAAWTFVAWGVYHGGLLAIERLALGRILSRLPSPFAHTYTLFMVLVGWILFRAESFEQAQVFILALFSRQEIPIASGLFQVLTSENLFYCFWGVIFSMPVIPILMRRLSVMPDIELHTEFGIPRTFLVMGLSLAAFLLCGIYIYSGTYNPFIYFRF